MTLSTSIANKLLDHLFRGEALDSPEAIFAGLLNASLAEMTALPGYKRRAAANFLGAPDGHFANVVQSFASAMAPSEWASVKHIGLFAAEEGGDLIQYAPIGHFLATIPAGFMLTSGSDGILAIGAVPDGMWDRGVWTPWTPIELTNLFFWFDLRDDETLGTTDSGLSAVAETDQVGYVEDRRGGNTRHVKQATSGSRPIYAGVDGLDFDGVNAYLESPAYTDLNQRARVYFQVFDIPVDTPDTTTAIDRYSSGGGTNSGFMCGVIAGTSIIAGFARNSSGTFTPATVSRANVAERVSVIFEWDVAGTVRTTVNSIANTISAAGANASPSGHITTRVGAGDPAGVPGRWMKDTLLMHGTVLGEITEAERTELMDYLNKVAAGTL